VKRCSKCGVEKDESEFYKEKKVKDGLCAHCKKCDIENRRKWREANSEKERETSRKWREANREKKREANRNWSEANQEKLRDANRRYREANREKVREVYRRYREANPEKVASTHAACYIKRTTGLTEVPEELVNAVVELRAFKREIKQLNNVITEKLK